MKPQKGRSFTTPAHILIKLLNRLVEIAWRSRPLITRVGSHLSGWVA